MTTTHSDWRHLARGEACPVCGSGDAHRNTLCMLAVDGTVAACGKSGGASWNGSAPFGHGTGGVRLHWYRLRDRDPNAPRVRRASAARAAVRRPNFDKLFAGWWHDVRADAARLDRFAASLGLPAATLTALGIGWAAAVWHPAVKWVDTSTGEERVGRHLIAGTTPCSAPGAWVFPMRDGDGRVTGARVRATSGAKYAVRGSDGDGVFAPAGLTPGAVLYAAEGPTSTAALLAMGLNAIGRPANQGGVLALLAYARRLRSPAVVVVGDNDLRWHTAGGRWEWPGHDGARAVEAAVRAAGIPVSVAFTGGGCKDPREWLKAGATRQNGRGIVGARTARPATAGTVAA